MKPKTWTIILLALTGVLSLILNVIPGSYDRDYPFLGLIIQSLPAWAFMFVAPGIPAGLVYLISRRANAAMWTWTVLATLIIITLVYGSIRQASGL
jgi:hypothetical protein